MILPPPRSTLFPYTTLFRSLALEIPAALRVLEPRVELGDAPRLHFRQRRQLLRRLGAFRANDLRPDAERRDRKSTRLNSSHSSISYAVFCLKKKNKYNKLTC